MSLRDETGNSGNVAGNGAIVLCPYEDAWKVKLKFLGTAKASFRPEQIWRVPSIIVPDDGRARLFNQSHSLSNIQIQLIALTGPGDFRFSNGVLFASSPWTPGMSEGGGVTPVSGGAKVQFATKEPSLLASIIGLGSVDELLIRYRDLTARTAEAAFPAVFTNH